MIRHLKGVDSTSTKATMATFNIGSMKDEVKEIKDSIEDNRKIIDKRIDSLIVMIEKREEAYKADKNKIWERLEQMYTDIKLHDYRLSKLDSSNKGGLAVIV